MDLQMETATELMTSLFLLLTLSLHGTISYVDVSRHNDVINDRNTSDVTADTG